MKKLIALLLALSILFAFAACEAKVEINANNNEEEKETNNSTEPTDNTEEDTVDLSTMTHAEYMAAAANDLVVIEAYVQNTQVWSDDAVTVYAQDDNGGYIIYNMSCTEEQYLNLAIGTKIRVIGYKAIWEGLHEIAAGATFEIIEEEPYVADPINLTGKLAAEGTEGYQGMLASFKGMTVEPSTDINGEEVAFLYNWDGSGEAGSDCDLYFSVSKNGKTYSFVVEYNLCDESSDAYKAVQALKVGDVIDMTGYVWWYNGIQPHIISVAASSGEEEESPAMTHEEFMAAENNAPIVIDAYVQATQSWWSDKLTVYAQGQDGGYIIYNMACSEEDAAKLVPGTPIRVTGYKAIWEGLHEVAEGATFEFIEDRKYVAPATDLTDKLGEDLTQYQGSFVSFKGMTVEAANDSGAAFLYNWDGSGEAGSDCDLYFNVSKDGKTFTFVVEYYLCNESSDVYKAVQNLKVGDVIDLEGFAWWYNGIQLHTTSLTVA